MKKLPFSKKKELVSTLRHIEMDNLPIASFNGVYIAPKSGNEKLGGGDTSRARRHAELKNFHITGEITSRKYGNYNVLEKTSLAS